MIVNVDMDGVLVDFNGFIKRQFGKNFVDLNNDWVWNELAKYKDLYAILDPMVDAFDLWNAIKHLNPQILTAVPSKIQMQRASLDKIEWVRNYLGKDVEVKFGPYSIDKQKWCNQGDVLIDDSYLNVSQWNNKGGIGILHLTADDTIKQLKIKGIL